MKYECYLMQISLQPQTIKIKLKIVVSYYMTPKHRLPVNLPNFFQVTMLTKLV